MDMSDVIQYPHNPRLLPLQGIENFRDSGGYQSRDGRYLKWGKLFRCGHLMQMTETDGGTLELLGIQAIFDLRTPPERNSFPSNWRCQRQPHTYTIDVHAAGDDPKADLFQLILGGQISCEQVRHHMLADYALMPYQFAPILQEICQYLLASNDAIVVHCTAGKDRTGLVTALLLALLDINEKDIFADYLLSNQGFSCREKLAHMVATFGHKVDNLDACMTVLKPLIQVERSYLEAALQAIKSRSGSLQRYFKDTLFMSITEQESLKNKLLEIK